MILLRSTVYFVAMLLSVGVYGLPIALVGWALPTHYNDRISSAWGRANLWLLRVICRLDFELEGAEHLPEGPCIVMAKHQSAWETIALRGILRPQQSWVLKQELMRLPLFGLGLKRVKSIPIDRQAGRKAIRSVVKLGTEYLQEGRDVIIFPEGTRTAPGERKKYGIGGGILAERSGYPVVPIAHNAGVYWRRRGVNKLPGTIKVAVGAPISTQGRKAKEIMQSVEDWIEDQVADMPKSAN
jgi:1-acyl-sn-glycerol-3-phosphate acyltransferase